MSTLPILDYGAPAEGAGAGGEGAPGQPAAVPENAVPTDGAAFAREAAIVPPEGADDLVSRAQWQWAIGESEAARGAEGASSSPAGDERATSPGTTKKRPTPRSRASPNAVAGDGKKRDGKKKTETTTLPRPGASVATSKNTESRRAAETAIARVEMTEARAKLAVVERLLEDKPVRCADSEYIRAAGEKNGADALKELRRLVAPLTGEEFMRACEERCLAGKCGWPLCGVSLSGCPGDDDARRLEGVGRGARAVRRTTKTPDGSAGSVRGGRGTYRIDAVRRKVYLRGDLDMFCGDAHRAEAEAVGVSLALPLDSETSEASAAQKKETRKEAEDGTDDADDAGAAATRNAKAKAMGDANANVKAAVLEKRPPAVVERRAPGASAPAPRAPSLAGLLGGGKGNEAAAAVEGYVPRRERRRRGEVSQKKSGRHETAAVTLNPKPETFPEPPEPERDGSSLGARALDLRLEKAARADDSTLAPRPETGDPSDPSTTPPGATFFFDVFAEGLERAERGSNIMGTFSEGQLSRVVPEAALPGLGLEAAGGGGDDDGASGENSGENGGENGGDADVAAATAAATHAAEASASAAPGPLDARRGAAAEQALAQAREALKATLTKVGASGDDRAGDGDGDDSRTESSGDSDDDDAVAPGAVSEFGTTWMMLDGWVTRATFAYVSADDTHILSSSSSSPDVSSRRTQNGSEPEPIAALPPRLGYAKQMSDAAASELRRALPSVRAALGIRASVLNLERSLGELMRTFFFDASIPALRPERWAVLVAAMLERGVAARAAAVARKNTREKISAATRSSEASGTETEEDASSRLVPHIVEDVAAARRDAGPLWALVAAAGASKEEYEAYGDLIAGECAKSW